MTPAVRRTCLALVAIVAVAAAIFALRLAGPPDFLDKDQPRPFAYICDCLDGNWICQVDDSGRVSSKPPLYTWLAAGSTLIFGPSRFAIYLPCALAVALIAGLAWWLARRRAGVAAGWWAAAAVLVGFNAFKQVALARTDAVFAATVAVAGVVALRCWERGGWWRFWLAAAVATLAKSPIGIVFAAAGLLAILAERRRAAARPLDGSGMGFGIALYLALAGGWFLAAWASLGQPLIDVMIGQELVRHAVANDLGDPLWRTFLLPPWWHAAWFMPWTVPLVAALWRIRRRPASSPGRRRAEAFCAWWLLAGLAVLMLAPHKRMDLALPLLLPGAILAGGELARWTAGWSWRRTRAVWLVVVLVGLVGMGCYQWQGRARDRRHLRMSEDSTAVEAMAAEAGRQGWPVVLHATPPPLRYLIPGRPARLAAGDAARRLQADPALVVISADPDALFAALGTGQCIELLAAQGTAGDDRVRLIAVRQAPAEAADGSR